MMRTTVPPGLALALLTVPAAASVTTSGTASFAIVQEASVAASPAQTWTVLLSPDRWWDKAHTYSGDAANLLLEPRAGGCFCERLADGGGVEHGRVVYVAPRSALRLRGALGPLQGEAVVGTLTFELTPTGAGTRVKLSYVVGGYMRQGGAVLAPLVDGVLAQQLARLKTAAEKR